MADYSNNLSKTIEIIVEAKNTNRFISEVSEERGLSKRYVKDRIQRIKNKRNRTKEEEEVLQIFEDYMKLYKKNYRGKASNRKKSSNREKSNDGDFQKTYDYNNLNEEKKKEVEYDAWQDDNYDERSKGETMREDKKDVIIESITGKRIPKITRYYYDIKIKGENDLIGYLSRDEMDVVYRLYSSLDGGGLTMRTVSRELKHLTFRDFKRILRAFNITKQSIPVAPHIIEEEPEEQVIRRIFLNKENNLLRKLDQQRGQQTEKLLTDVQRELLELKYNRSSFSEFIKDFDFDSIKPFKIEKKKLKNKDKALLVYIADIHTGAKTLEDSIYTNDYDESEFQRRIILTAEKIVEYTKIYGRFDKLIICNLGDSVDGYNSQTTRGGHMLPQNMSNKEQFNIYIKVMLSFFDFIAKNNPANNIEFYCVTNDNHAGDFGYMANKTIEHIISFKYPDIKSFIFEKFIEHFNYGKHTFVLSHGKDKIDMRSGFPTLLDEKTQNYFNEYIAVKNIQNPFVSVCLGDKHITVTQYGKMFRWRRVGSLYGSSSWVHTNFGNSRACVEFEIVDKDEEHITEERLWF